MAGGMRRIMEHLGLVDPPYEEDYEYGYQAEPATAPQMPPARPRPQADDGMGSGTIRPLPRDPSGGETPAGGVTPIPRPARQVQAVKEPRVHVVRPAEFSDGQEIGDRIKQGAPVVVAVADTDPA